MRIGSIVRMLLCGGILLGSTTARADAAEIHLTRDADGLAFISVEGELKMDDGEKFAELAGPVNRAVVMFNSPGGRLVAGLQMGRLIRLKHFATWVPDGQLCASACASAWLAGTPRAMQLGSQIGFHAAFIEQDGAKIETGIGNALAGAYFEQLGFSTDAIIFFEQAAPDEISWLTPETASRYGIAIRLVPPTKTASNSPPPVTPVSRAVPDPARNPVATKDLSATVLEGRARGFADEYFAHWSETADRALSFFGSAYATEVTFYGQPLAQSDILAAKRDYTQRWPVRVYNARPDTLGAFCNPASGLCALSGTVDWDCRNPGRNARSAGSATFILTLDLNRDRPMIVAESGAVVSRTP